MRFWGVLLAGLVTMTAPALAQTLDGDWHGTLDTPTGAHLRLLFHFSHEGGALKAQFTSVDQSPVVFPAPATLDDHHLTIALPRDSSFDGTLSADGKSIVGDFIKGVKLPLTLVPGSLDVPVLHPAEPGDMLVETPTGKLAATLIRKGPVGAVLLNGSGGANRDGNSVENGGRNTYRLIAEGLAAQNISSLRYDKRGVGESAGAVAREDDITMPLMVDDARHVAATLKNILAARCVWLVGHSEGAVVALQAAQDNPDICGLVLLASPGRPVMTILRDQFSRFLPPASQPKAYAIIAAIEAGKPMGDVPAELQSIFRPSLMPYWRSQLGVDPPRLAARLKVPMLLLQGDADVQISLADDAKALARAKPDAVLKIEPGVNHSQRIAKDDHETGPAPLAPGVIENIAGFIKAHP